MPLKVVENEKNFVLGTEIPKKTIITMVQNFINRTFKGYRKVTRDTDSHAVYYSKKEIDELFAANYDPSDPNAVYGLRIYLALHGDTSIEWASMPNRPKSYVDHHTVILVCTKNKKDLLSPVNFVSLVHPISTTPGTGLEEGEICPPPKCSGGEIDDHLEP